ncbi:PIN domain-containing protein [soil metagenome]
MSGSFFDSNALLYLASPESQKIERVRSLLRNGGFISVQVLNEMTRVSRRKFGMSWSDTHRLLNTVREFVKVGPLTLETHEAGLRLAERYGFSIYDSFIVAATLVARCDTLWSEDMRDGMLVDARLRIANPFRS